MTVCHVGCVHARKPVCYCHCGGRGHGVPAVHRVHRRRTDTQAGYLNTVYSPDSPLPWGGHRGTPIKALPVEFLRETVARGLTHRQLYGVIREVLHSVAA